MAKHRSPSAPYFSLPDAISHVRTIYDNEQRHSVPVEVLVRHCGYENLKSSSALRLLATLKMYGLVDDVGRGEAREMKVSDRALDILLAENEQSPERLKAIKDAATEPFVHQQILEAFPGELPSDANLRAFLIRKLDFNDSQAVPFIKKFRETMTLAGAIESDKMPDEMNGNSVQPTSPATISPETGFKSPAASKLPGLSQPHAGSSWDGPTIEFDLPRGNKVQIRLRSKLSPKEFENLKKIFDLSELAFVEEASGPEVSDD